MPITPHIESATNFVRRLKLLPCATPPALYVELAIDASLHVIWSFLEPDLREVYHQAVGESALCSLKGVLKDSKFVPPEHESKATRFLFKTAEWADLSIWYGFLAALAAEGLAEFTSQLMKFKQCTGADHPYVGSGPFFFGALHDDGQWDELDFSAQPGSIYYPVWPSHVTVKPGKAWAMACSASFHDFGGFPVACQALIRDMDTGFQYDAQEQTQEQADANQLIHTWAGGRNLTGFEKHIQCVWSYQGMPLPLHEAFPDHDGFGFKFAQP